MSFGDDAITDYSTMRGRDYPSIRQFTVFMENRVGQLLEIVRRFEGSHVRIVALNIIDSTECSVVRFLLSHPEQGRESLERAGLAMLESRGITQFGLGNFGRAGSATSLPGGRR